MYGDRWLPDISCDHIIRYISAELPSCTAKTNIIVYVNYTLIKNIHFDEAMTCLANENTSERTYRMLGLWERFNKHTGVGKSRLIIIIISNTITNK